ALLPTRAHVHVRPGLGAVAGRSDGAVDAGAVHGLVPRPGHDGRGPALRTNRGERGRATGCLAGGVPRVEQRGVRCTVDVPVSARFGRGGVLSTRGRGGGPTA